MHGDVVDFGARFYSFNFLKANVICGRFLQLLFNLKIYLTQKYGFNTFNGHSCAIRFARNEERDRSGAPRGD